MIRSRIFLGKKSFQIFLAFLPALVCLFSSGVSYSATVTNLHGFYRDGQVFLTWTNAVNSASLYKVYRSTSKITASGQLSACEYLGFTNQKSSVNHNLSKADTAIRYLRIDSAGALLNSSTGLFVATTLVNGNYYYAVTVTTDLVEDQTIFSGANSLSVAVAETVAPPMPVFQEERVDIYNLPFSIYTTFTSSKYSMDQPLLVNAGFIPFDFAFYLNNANGNNPLRIYFHGGASNYIDRITSVSENEVRLQIEDFLPDSAQYTEWWGCNPAYDIYDKDNNIPPTNGININFSQLRISQVIEWAIHHLPIDSNRIYFDANSNGSPAAFFYAITYPDKIAAVELHVGAFDFSFLNDWQENCSLNADGNNRKDGDKLFGEVSTNLMSNLGIHTYHALNGGWMIHEYPYKSYPFIYSINGKNDDKMGWTEKTIFYDSLKNNPLGGYYFWDNRTHGGGANTFWGTDNFRLYRYRRNASFPAFANCSLNEDFGDGNGASGGSNGSVNGMLDWNDSITDDPSVWQVKVCVRDLLTKNQVVVVYPDSCTADICPKRLQHFFPAPGSVISWNASHNNQIIKSGSFVYGGGLMVIPNVKIYKDTTIFTLTATTCPVATLTPSGTIVQCKGSAITLSANTGTGYIYNWLKGSKVIGGATQSTYTTGENESGNFSVIITASGCSDTSAITVIKRLALPTATITPLSDPDICVTGSVILKANSGTGYTFQWKKGATILAGETNKKYTATKKGTYTVIVTNTSNCSKTSDEIKVTKSCKESPMLKFAANMSIQPNPATNAVTIQFSLSQSSVIAIMIFDVNGKEISGVANENYEAGEHSLQINTASFAKGIYLVQLISVDGIKNEKLIVQ